MHKKSHWKRGTPGAFGAGSGNKGFFPQQPNPPRLSGIDRAVRGLFTGDWRSGWEEPTEEKKRSKGPGMEPPVKSNELAMLKKSLKALQDQYIRNPMAGKGIVEKMNKLRKKIGEFEIYDVRTNREKYEAEFNSLRNNLEELRTTCGYYDYSGSNKQIPEETRKKIEIIGARIAEIEQLLSHGGWSF